MSTRFDEARAALERARRKGEQERTPSTLFDPVQADIADRDQAIASVEHTWRGQVLDELDEALERLARARATFTIDDLRDQLPSDLGDGSVDLRVLGATVTRAARRRLIQAGGYAPSRRRHSSPVRVWQSLIHDSGNR